MERASYRTKQRELMWNYLQTHSSEHITAKMMMESLRAQGETIGKSTVYRFLDGLVDEGVLRKFFLEDGGGACYQLEDGGREFFHLKCLRCGRLYHIMCEQLSEMEEHVRESHHFCIDSARFVLYGMCEGCSRIQGDPPHDK